MARPLKVWPQNIIERVRELAEAGVINSDIRVILETEFNLAASDDVLRARMRANNIKYPRRVYSYKRGNNPGPWSEAKVARLRELVTTGSSQRQVMYRLLVEFGAMHSWDLVRRKIREHCSDLIPETQQPELPAQAEPPKSKISNFESASEPVPTPSSEPWKLLRVRHCQYPFGTPGKPGFRFCDKAPLSGKSYCDEHQRLCWTGKGALHDIGGGGWTPRAPGMLSMPQHMAGKR